MENNISIRNISKADIEWARNLRNVNKNYFFNSKIVSTKQQEKWFNSLTYPFFVIEFNNTPIGTIAVKMVMNEYVINNVLIDQKYRRKGVLKRVVSILEKKFGLPLFVDVKLSNKLAFSVYKKLGFSLISYRMQKR